MSTQLRLIEGGRRARPLDARTKRIGQQGVQAARETLATIQPPKTTGTPRAPRSVASPVSKAG